jgi:hypothetical protein
MEMIDLLAEFVVYNSWLGDKRDFKVVRKNAEQFLLEKRVKIK